MESSQDKGYLKLSKLYVILESTSNFKEKYVEFILQEEGDINYQLPSDTALGSINPELIGCTALHLVYKRDQIKIFNLLLKAGADCTITNNNGLSVLHEIIADTYGKNAADNVYLNSILEAYINAKAIFKSRNKHNLTFFHAACISGKLFNVKSCLRIGTAVDQLVEFSHFKGYTSLHLAVQYCNYEVVDIILKYQPNLNLKNARKLTPLQMVIERWIQKRNENSDDDKIIELLLKANDETGVIDDETGLSHLHVACTMKSITMLEQILPTIRDVDQMIYSNSPVFAGYSALHFAAICNLEAVKLLMRKGANILLKNSTGQTPFDLCMERYEIKDIHEILSIQSLFQNILLTNGLRFLDLILAMDGHDPHQFHLENNLTSRIFVAFSSPLWPGYSILHVAVMFAEKKCSNNNNLVIKHFLNPKSSINYYIQYIESPLHLAFRLNKTFAVHELLNYSNLVPYNITNHDGLTFLHIACAAGNQENLDSKMLNHIQINRQLRADYQWRDLYIPKGVTALHIAVMVGNYELVKILMDEGADPYIKDVNGMTPIHWLLISNNSSMPIVDLLLKPPKPDVEFVPVVTKKKKRTRKKKNSTPIVNLPQIPGSLVEIIAKNGLTHLHVASFFGNVKIVEKLRQSGSNVNAAINHNLIDDVKKFPGLVGFAGYTALNLAMKNNHQNVVRLLLLNGANIFVGKSNSSNALIDVLLNQPKNHAHPFICIIGNSNILQQRVFSRYGLKMLHLYSYVGDIESVKTSLDNFEFIDSVVDKNSPIWPGFTPLHVVVKHYLSNGLLQMLLDRGADVTKSDINGCTPVHLVYYSDMNMNDKIQIMSLLMRSQKKFQNNPTDKKGLSHFHIACALIDLNAMKEFLKLGVDVNQPVNHFHDSKLAGCTALHLVLNPSLNQAIDTAVKLKAIKSLIKHGADVHAKDTYENTPLHFAGRCDPRFIMDFIQRLLDAGARINEENMKGQTIFEIMLKSTSSQMSEVEYMDVIGKFLKLGCDINHQDRLGNTPLHIATQSRNHPGIVALLNAGADVNIVDTSSKTAFAYAVEDPSSLSVRYDDNSKEIVQTFAYHVQKLNLCLMDVHEMNHKVLAEASQNYSINVNLSCSFCEQLMMAKLFKIETTELTLFDFISETKAVVKYSTLPQTQQLAIDKYFESIDSTPLTELIGIIRLQYRKALAKRKLHA